MPGLKKGQRNSGQFKPGHKGGGRHHLPQEIKTARNDAFDKMVEDVIRVREMTIADAELRVKDFRTTLGERVILRAYLTQDAPLIKNYEDRVFGKAIESHRFVGKEGEDRDILTLLGGVDAQEIIKLGRALVGVTE